MAIEKKKPLSIINTYLIALKGLRSQPQLFVPFLTFALIELIFLFIFYIAPRRPYSLILAPPIKAFWGERFLHYPENFLILPKLTSLSRNFLSCILGSLLSGWAVVMAADTYNKKKVQVKSCLKTAFNNYFSLFTIVLLIVLSYFGLFKLIEIWLMKYFASGHPTLLFLRPGIWLGPGLIAISLLLAILVQAVFIYSIPILLIEKKKLFVAIAKSLLLSFKLFLPTLVLIGLPILIYLPIVALQYKTPFLIERTFPELVLYVCILEVLINALVVDLFMTLSTAILFLENKNKNE